MGTWHTYKHTHMMRQTSTVWEYTLEKNSRCSMVNNAVQSSPAAPHEWPEYALLLSSTEASAKGAFINIVALNPRSSAVSHRWAQPTFSATLAIKPSISPLASSCHVHTLLTEQALLLRMPSVKLHVVPNHSPALYTLSPGTMTHYSVQSEGFYVCTTRK